MDMVVNMFERQSEDEFSADTAIEANELRIDRGFIMQQMMNNVDTFFHE